MIDAPLATQRLRVQSIRPQQRKVEDPSETREVNLSAWEFTDATTEPSDDRSDNLTIPSMEKVYEPTIHIEQQFERSVNSTLEIEYPIEILDELQTLVFSAKDEVFEDGIETGFSRGLVAYIERYGELALQVLTDFIISERINPEIASEGLRWIGRIENPYSRLSRRRLLEWCLLNCNSSRVKDGALLGLASMDDPSSIPYLELAVERETIQELRQDMGQVLEQLKVTTLERMS